MTLHGVGRATLRRAQPDDAAVVAHLLWDFNTEFDTPAPDPELMAGRFIDLLGRDDVLVVFAELDGKAVGFAYVTYRPTPYFDGPLAQLEELYIQPDLRDQGIGTVLLQRVLAEARSRNAGELHIGVDEVDIDTRRFMNATASPTSSRGRTTGCCCICRSSERAAPAHRPRAATAASSPSRRDSGLIAVVRPQSVPAVQRCRRWPDPAHARARHPAGSA